MRGKNRNSVNRKRWKRELEIDLMTSEKLRKNALSLRKNAGRDAMSASSVGVKKQRKTISRARGPSKMPSTAIVSNINIKTIASLIDIRV